MHTSSSPCLHNTCTQAAQIPKLPAPCQSSRRPRLPLCRAVHFSFLHQLAFSHFQHTHLEQPKPPTGPDLRHQVTYETWQRHGRRAHMCVEIPACKTPPCMFTHTHIRTTNLALWFNTKKAKNHYEIEGTPT
jgi:hypothetical protein